MLDFRQQLINSTLTKILQRPHYPLGVMLACVRWYVAYPLSLRHVEEMMQERGVFVDHFTVHRWAIKDSPVLAAVFRKRKRPVGSNWRMGETYIKVAVKWKHLYRGGLTAPAIRRFLERARKDHHRQEWRQHRSH
jgi:putative transposase